MTPGAPSWDQIGVLQRPSGAKITKKSSGGATRTAHGVVGVAKQILQDTPDDFWAIPGCNFQDHRIDSIKNVLPFCSDFRWISASIFGYCFDTIFYMLFAAISFR